MLVCPLCYNKKSFEAVEGPDTRAYKCCKKCKLIFAEARFLPSENNEKERYMTHENGIQHKGYVDFLNQAVEPALPLLSSDMQCLDFGCGPAPTLSVILKQKGFTCDDYDLLFFPGLPDKEYDFIFATECFEHFFYPAKEIQRIENMLKPGGILIVMTETWKSTKAFSRWHYAKDFTHVSFYHNQTFDFIAREFGFETRESNNERVMILQKK